MLKMTGIADRANRPIVRSIDLTETFQEEDTVELTAEELKEARAIHEEAQLRRRDPAAWQAKKASRQKQQELEYRQRYPQAYQQAQTHLQGRPHAHPQGSQYFMSTNNHELPTNVPYEGSIILKLPGTSGEPNGASTSHGVETMQYAANTNTDIVSFPPAQQPSRAFPILGANTIRRNASISPEKQIVEAPLADRAESEPRLGGSTMAAGRAQTIPIAQIEHANAALIAQTPLPRSTLSINPDPPSPSSASTLKRKLSSSSVLDAQQPTNRRLPSSSPSNKKMTLPYPELSNRIAKRL